MLQAPSAKVVIICSDHRLLWQDSDKEVDHASTSPEFKLHQIIIIVVIPKELKSFHVKKLLLIHSKR